MSESLRSSSARECGRREREPAAELRARVIFLVAAADESSSREEEEAEVEGDEMEASEPPRGRRRSKGPLALALARAS